MKLKGLAVWLTAALACTALTVGVVVGTSNSSGGFTPPWKDPTGSNSGVNLPSGIDPTGATASTLVGTPGDEIAENACYLYTPRMTEDAFRYLDEIYTEKYPELGLRWEHGTGADQRIFTAFAQQITAGCNTDAEKVTAIYNWVVANIRYVEECSPFSMDTLYNGIGNCLSQSMLMQDLCRVLGIPAVYSVGFRGYMKTFTVEAMHTAEVGHAWLFVYVDGQWLLYDPVWRTNGTADQDFIAESFYIDNVGGITPIYDENHMPPFASPEAIFAYMNGTFIGLSNGTPRPGFGSHWLNFAMNVSTIAHGENDGMFYLDGPASFVYVGGPEECELYTNGWLTYGDSCFLIGDPLHYFYENGIQASEVVLNRNGTDFYFNQGNGFKICIPEESYRMINGVLKVDSDYRGMVWEPHEQYLPEGNYTYRWATSDESIATVDENGIVTCHKPGAVDIICFITGTGYMGNEEYVIDESDMSVVITPIIENGEVIGDLRSYNRYITVYFSEDISRPAEYAALDYGGPAYIETEVPRIGNCDYYPIMTDDMLMMFDPVGDIITLPTAQNANGYFILPETYEAALNFPYDFELPLAEGSLILDRNKLREFILVDTEQWGEMWYLPLNEDGEGIWEPVGGYAPPTSFDFGNTMIPSDELYQNGTWEPRITDATPENGVIRTQLLPVVPEFPMPNYKRLDLSELQYVIDQNCALEIIIQGNSLTLDTAALQTLLNSAGNNFTMLWMVEMKTEWCDYGQQTRLNRMATAGIYNICFESSGNMIHDLQGGAATVTVPLNATGGEYGAFLVDAYGNFTEVSSTVNGDTITFVAPYFATYAIIDTAETPVN